MGLLVEFFLSADLVEEKGLKYFSLRIVKLMQNVENSLEPLRFQLILRPQLPHNPPTTLSVQARLITSLDQPLHRFIHFIEESGFSSWTFDESCLVFTMDITPS